MEKKENQRITLTKKLLKDGLVQLLQEKAINKITVCELCELSGINRSTFYKHYGCPADVLREIEQDFVTDLEDIWKTGHFVHHWTLGQRTEALCNYLAQHATLAKLMFQNSSSDSEFAEILFHSAHVKSVYEDILSHEQDPSDRRLLMSFLMNGTYYTLRQWILEDMPKPPREMGTLIQRAVEHH